MTKRTKILEIHQYDHPFSPREDDNVGTMVCWHRDYTLGDEQPKNSPTEYREGMIAEVDEQFLEDLEEESEKFFDANPYDPLAHGQYERVHREWDEIYEDRIATKLAEHYIILPLYLYDHSGLSISTGSFSCPWDSGQVGFIYVSRALAAEEYGAKTFPELRYKDDEVHEFQSLDELAEYYLTGEVETYDQYLRGDVYGFVLRGEDGEEEDSCWGFYGDDWRTNGITDHVNLSEVKAVHYMEQQTYTRMEPADIEELSDGTT